MGFSIELDEDTARRLHQLAARQNVDPADLGREYVRDRVQAPSPVEPKVTREERAARLKQVLEEIDELSHRSPAPSLPDEALTRNAIYADHD